MRGKRLWMGGCISPRINELATGVHADLMVCRRGQVVVDRVAIVDRGMDVSAVDASRGSWRVEIRGRRKSRAPSVNFQTSYMLDPIS